MKQTWLILLSAPFKIVACITNLLTKIASSFTWFVIKSEMGARRNLPYPNILQGFLIQKLTLKYNNCFINLFNTMNVSSFVEFSIFQTLPFNYLFIKKCSWSVCIPNLHNSKKSKMFWKMICLKVGKLNNNQWRIVRRGHLYLERKDVKCSWSLCNSIFHNASKYIYWDAKSYFTNYFWLKVLELNNAW